MFETLVSRIEQLAIQKPQKLALGFKKETLYYVTLWQKVQDIAAWIKEQGVLPGDRVCFSAVSKPEMVAVYLGVQYCGAVAVFLDKNANTDNMIRICQAADAKLLLTDKPVKETAGCCPVYSLRKIYADAGCLKKQAIKKEPVKENDLAEILFTTGTTGTPKGVMLSYGAVYNIFCNTRDGIGYSEDTVLLLPLPLHHSYALRVLRAVLSCGGTVVLQNGFIFAKETENNIVNYSCNAMACVPTSYEVLKGQMQDKFQVIMSKLSLLEFGAGSLTISQRKEIIQMLPNVQIYNVWGSSESGGAIFCNVNAVVEKENIVGSLGRPLEGKVEVAFLSDAAPLEKSERITGHLRKWMVNTDSAHPGRMLVRGGMLMSGYWKAEELTSLTLIDGWLITGDLAYQDADGNIFMLGRADDLINMGGEKISPIEVENIAGQYEYIRDCACIGAADTEGYLDQIPVLFLVTRPGYSEKEFLKWMLGKTEKTKLPQKIVIVDEIPRNRMQKIDRKALKKLWDNRDSLALMNPVIDNILSRRSIRKFKEESISREMLDMILKCGIAAPSGHNLQSWKFTVLTNSDDIQKLKKLSEETAEANHVVMYGFENPQVLILVSNDKRNPDGCQDASCAAENMMLAAHSFGLGSVWLNMLMTLRDKDPVKSFLDEHEVPENHIVWATIALGWPVADGIRLQKKTDVVTFA